MSEMSFNKSLLELSIRAKDLSSRNADKDSPQCIVYMRTTASKYVEIGRTEVIRNSRNPDWTVRVPVGYRFSQCQELKLEVWDYDLCADNELLGETEVDLAALVVTNERPIKKRLKLSVCEDKLCRQTITGDLYLTVDEVLASKQTVRMQFQAKRLPQKDFFGLTDPYLTISKQTSEGNKIEIYRSEVIYKSLEPMWNEFTVRVLDLCDCDHHKPLTIACFDWDRHSSDDFIGSVTTSLSELNRHVSGLKVFELKRNDHFSGNSPDFRSSSRRKSFLLKAKPEVPTAGDLSLNSLVFKRVPTFMDYVRIGGTQIHLMTAIDFTQESQAFHRRLVTDPNSGRQMNFVEYLIRSLGRVLSHYDFQGLYAGFGFGGRLPPDHKQSHAFNLKVDSAMIPYCDTIEDLIRSYKTSLTYLEAGSQRHLAPVISQVTQLTKNFINGKHYFLLLVVTSGSNSDNLDTLDAIVRASAMPLTIALIGVGSGHFSNLKRLSGDSTCSRGTRTLRNNIQFFQTKHYSSGDVWDESLTEHILQQIPQQMLEFMDSRNFLANPSNSSRPSSTANY